MRVQPAATDTFSALKRKDGNTIAYHQLPPHPDKASLPGVIFFGGFHSDMTGTKATFLQRYCHEHGLGFVRFDYFGHGLSSGAFTDGTIGRWKEDALEIIDRLTTSPQILIGSSMGAWIMLLACVARPHRVASLIGLASAPDFTEDLIWNAFTPAEKEKMMAEGRFSLPAEHCTGEYIITRQLIEEAREHLLLRGPIPVTCPVRLLHGMKDQDVPWQTSEKLLTCLPGARASLRLVHRGDHRLSTEEDLAVLAETLEEALRNRQG
ncbi:MAG: alpha/beta hydrolase [Alphaproteobacteria bacterium]|nr:alpha/beta hydrolase [Alphaproteobacteria bacterium]